MGEIVDNETYRSGDLYDHRKRCSDCNQIEKYLMEFSTHKYGENAFVCIKCLENATDDFLTFIARNT